jgi:hypothetical protein
MLISFLGRDTISKYSFFPSHPYLSFFLVWTFDIQIDLYFFGAKIIFQHSISHPRSSKKIYSGNSLINSDKSSKAKNSLKDF